MGTNRVRTQLHAPNRQIPVEARSDMHTIYIHESPVSVPNSNPSPIPKARHNMYGRPPRFAHGGGGPESAPSLQPPPQHHLLGANFNPNNFLQNPNDLLYLQNLNLHFPNALLNPYNFPFQNQSFQAQNNNFQPQNPINHFQSFPQPQPARPNGKEALERIDREVVKARRDILASGDNVSAWKVSQAVCLALKADSWESLGFQMQQVPSLHNLIVTEGKINAFIHCFVAVRRITTLYDLELAICENEGIEQFEELDLGPLVRHPLVVHYFSVSSDVKEVFRITSEEIISCLHEFMNTQQGKEVKIDELLDFIAEKRSLTGREKLNVRIQNLGRHITHIRKAVQSENITMKKYVDGLKEKFGIKIRKRPILSSQKKQMDERFNNISQRIKSFSGSNANFCGKHIRFSSSSDEDDSSATDNEDNQCQNGTHSNSNLKSQNPKSSDRVSSCPYPSVAEEMRRLGLKPEVDDNPGESSANTRCGVNEEPLKRKRKPDSTRGSISVPRKLPKRDEDKTNLYKGDTKRESCYEEENDSAVFSESTRMFIATWKEACRHNRVDEVLERMLNFYGIKKKKKLRALFSSHPFAGLFDIAVKSIKCGLFDSMYDAFQTFSHRGVENGVSENNTNYISVEVESSQQDAPVSSKKPSKPECGVSSDDIIKKVTSYFEPDSDVFSHANPSREKKFLFLRKLCRCESWLIEQFSVKEFECFGYGDFMTFVERHLHLLPHVLQKLMIGETSEKLSIEVRMLQLQLDVLLAQASTGAWENDLISKQKILTLLRRQFPSFCFKSVESNMLVDCREMIRENEGNIIPKCVLFSATLLKETGIGDSTTPNKKIFLDSAGFEYDVEQKAGSLGSVTTKDAIEVLLRAPMLTDLDSWSHWDLIYAPSLGPLVVWLLSEVNTKELFCLVTNSGKIIRLDHSATLDSLLEVLLKGSSFETAVEMLSLLALYGGERNVPLSLLKCHANKAFHVLLDNSVEKDLSNDQHSVVREDLLTKQVVFKDEKMFGNFSHELNRDRNRVNKGVVWASRFVLDCLGYVPTEFCSFAASVLLSGFQSCFKDAPSAILSECQQVEQRIMLHDVGFSLGIMEWINDYQTFRSAMFTNSLFSSKPSCSKLTSYDLNRGAEFLDKALSECPSSSGGSIGTDKADHSSILKFNHTEQQISEVPARASSDDSTQCSSELNFLNPTRIIESIRRDEFGLDPSLSTTESKMLKKQHARLGRALHCLSHELYSQDSHFLLELVQNADDNIYPQNVEPTLVFVLQEKGIVVMNNEIGFSAENIRALCDVGNSTKKGQGAGYIGKKGIGFKSVFRVTDAPEIHSNGFHIKFDITEGQIGFVLPTEVPPCDIDLYSRLVMTDSDQMNCNSWSTCIVLPFKETLSASFTMSNIMSMFSDLHPSLLLFLHRLKCIKFREMLSDSLIVMKKEVLTDGIIQVSLGKEKMYWFVVSQKLRADSIRPDVHSTEISIAFTLEETGDGGYTPQLNQQPVFAFLPLRTYGLKFILQGDFVLPSSREEVDGDSPWNQWLLSEFPGLFVGAERAFCDLPCFRRSPGKAVTAFMSFVPLVGEVQGFFSCLPRMIISKLRMSNCLLLEGDNNEWVPPCKVLRNWNEEARILLPERLLHKHLGLGFLNKDIVLPDSLARALGIEDYGHKILLQIISSLSHSESDLKLMGLGWLSAWINSIYLMSLNSGTESDFIISLRKIPFIPLSDGKHGSVDRGTIWLHSGITGVDSENDLEAFPKLYAKLRTVSPELFSAAAAADKSCIDKTIVENVTRMLLKVGVQRLSAHEIVKVHILPAISDTRNILGNEDLMTEYLCFIMFHVQSGCRDCYVEREWIMEHLRSRALILTNYGYKRLNEGPIHFNKEYGNQISMNKLLDGMDLRWHEVDTTYLRHPITKSLCDGMSKWRNFFQELGVTDFVQIVQSEKCIGEISHDVLKDMMQDGDMISIGSVAKDWESPELVHLLSHLSSRGDREKCKYLLEILDTFWDDCFSDKVIGYCNFSSGESKPFTSSLVSILQNVQWMASIMDDDFHYPKDLFHDCEAVRSILGVAAPYVVPKVKNQKMIVDLGLKSQVRLDDILTVLKSWRKTEKPIKASISQMLKLYTFIWNEMTSSKQKTVEELSSGPFIFVPFVPAPSPDGVVTGSLLSPKEVYWYDTTGFVDQMKLMHPKCVSEMTHLSFSKMLRNVYPTLHDFFVNECGVEEFPPSNSYLQILLQLSTMALPSQAATTVFHVFSKWADGLISGSLDNDDVEYLRESFLKKECAVLPTEQDKWVSLHPSFGLICWSDDENLRKEFKHQESIDLLYFGDLCDDEKEMLQTKVAILFRRLGIPPLSGVVSREGIYYGPTDSSFKASLVNWALPYAQRYISHVHPNKYLQLRKSGFEKLRHLQIVVVEKLFYRNVVKRYEIASKKRIECSCLLQGNILYATRDSDSHSIFMELSHLLFGEAPDLHLANFLHMITTMVEAGSTEEQTEFFILNSQKVPKLPVEEPVWCLSLPENNNSPMTDSVSTSIDESNILKSKRRPGVNPNWPPVDWRTAPGFKFAQANGLKTQASSSLQMREATDATEMMAIQTDHKAQAEMNDNWTFEDGVASTSQAVCLQDTAICEVQADHAGNMAAFSLDPVFDSVDLVTASDGPNCGSSTAVRNHISLGSSSAQAMLTGRLGEFVAFKYFVGKVGETSVRWVNEANETGLPYDLVIGSEERSWEFVEVKATKSGKKNWFDISAREWQFASEKGGSFSVAHVVLLENNTAKVTVYKNPIKLCQLGKLRLAVLIPKQLEFSNVS